MTVIIVLLYCF